MTRPTSAGKEKNKHASKRRHAGRDGVGKAAVVGVKDRATNRASARVVERTDGETLQGFVHERTKEGATVYTDEHGAYRGLPTTRPSGTRSGSTSGSRRTPTVIESFWTLLERGYHGVYHHMTVKHLQRYVEEFAGRYSIRDADTIRQVEAVVVRLVGRRLL